MILRTLIAGLVLLAGCQTPEPRSDTTPETQVQIEDTTSQKEPPKKIDDCASEVPVIDLDGSLARILPASVIQNPGKFRVQILVSFQTPEGCLSQWIYRADEEYFYPASAIKTVASLEALRLAEELGVGLDETLRFQDSDPGETSLRKLVEDTQIISSNLAFNRLYEFAGPDRIHQYFWSQGFSSLRLFHRMFSKRTLDEERIVPAIEICRGEPCAFEPLLPSREGKALTVEKSTRTLIGESYFDPLSNELKSEPMDFSVKNAFDLRDHQKLNRTLIFGEFPGLSLASRNFLLETMSREPESSLTRFKPLTPGLLGPRVRYTNKAGRALGFHVENAALSDPSRPLGQCPVLFVTAAIYVNEDGRLNDDQYEYDTISFPFFEALGREVSAYLEHITCT